MNRLSPIQLAETWRKFLAQHADRERQQLLSHYHVLVKITAGRVLKGATNGEVERDDLVGAGMFGLIKALDQFDPARGVKFETYAITLIKGACLEYLRGDDWVPRLVRNQEKAYLAAYQTLECRHGRTPTQSELATALGITESALAKRLTLFSRSKTISLQSLVRETWSHTGYVHSLLDMVAAEENAGDSIVETICAEERRRCLVDAIQRLPEREQTVLARYYQEEKTFKVIGGEMGISESRAYQLHAQALLRLRGYLQWEHEEGVL